MIIIKDIKIKGSLKYKIWRVVHWFLVLFYGDITYKNVTWQNFELNPKYELDREILSQMQKQ